MGHSTHNELNKTSATKNLYKNPQKLLDVFKEIYDYSKIYEEYALSLQNSLREIQIIASGTQDMISIEDILVNRFGDSYNNITIINSIPSNQAQPKKAMFLKALEAVIGSLLAIGAKDNYNINLNIQFKCTAIEIILDIAMHPVDNNNVEQFLKKARLFALLDEGFVEIYRTENQLIFTIVYSNKTHPTDDYCNECILPNCTERMVSL